MAGKDHEKWTQLKDQGKQVSKELRRCLGVGMSRLALCWFRLDGLIEQEAAGLPGGDGKWSYKGSQQTNKTPCKISFLFLGGEVYKWKEKDIA